jgi:hypothetical protein
MRAQYGLAGVWQRVPKAQVSDVRFTLLADPEGLGEAEAGPNRGIRGGGEGGEVISQRDMLEALEADGHGLATSEADIDVGLFGICHLDDPIAVLVGELTHAKTFEKVAVVFGTHGDHPADYRRNRNRCR